VAALLLPGLPPAAGVGIALRTRGAAHTLGHIAAVAGRPPSPSAASLFPLADMLVATNYLTALIDDVDDGDLLLLTAPALHGAPGLHAAAEAAGGALGTWPQVAAFLALAAALFPAAAQRARDAVLNLGGRLSDCGHAGEALLVRSVLPRVLEGAKRAGDPRANLASLDAMLAIQASAE
jgi:hypothetical protein